MSDLRPAPPRGCRETVPVDSERHHWSVDPEAGLIQGPLELDFFSGRRLELMLARGQIALLVRNSNLSAVYLEGNHSLRVGRDDDCIRPDATLLFLDTVRTFSVTWDQRQSLWIPDAMDHMIKLPISGGCSCRIADATRFYSAFLRGIDSDAVDFALQVIDCVVRTRLEEKLGQYCGDEDTDRSALQEFIDGLAPSDIDDDLDRLGLACESLSVHLPRTRTLHLASGQTPDLQVQKGH